MVVAVRRRVERQKYQQETGHYRCVLDFPADISTRQKDELAKVAREGSTQRMLDNRADAHDEEQTTLE